MPSINQKNKNRTKSREGNSYFSCCSDIKNAALVIMHSMPLPSKNQKNKNRTKSREGNSYFSCCSDIKKAALVIMHSMPLPSKNQKNKNRTKSREGNSYFSCCSDIKKAALVIMHSMPNPNLNGNHLKSVLRLNTEQPKAFYRLTHGKRTLTTSPYFQHRFAYQYTRTKIKITVT